MYATLFTRKALLLTLEQIMSERLKVLLRTWSTYKTKKAPPEGLMNQSWWSLSPVLPRLDSLLEYLEMHHSKRWSIGSVYLVLIKKIIIKIQIASTTNNPWLLVTDLALSILDLKKKKIAEFLSMREFPKILATKIQMQISIINFVSVRTWRMNGIQGLIFTHSSLFGWMGCWDFCININ